MPWRWTPARRRGIEILDDPATPDALRERAMRDVARANRYFGGARALVLAVRAALQSADAPTRLIDVGTGTGDLPSRIRRDAERHGKDVWIAGTDISPALLSSHREAFDAVACGDAVRLPFRDGSADLVTCSQLLHHFDEPQARVVIAELHRVAKQGGAVIIADLRRSRLAAAGFWVACWLFGFHPVTRRDGVTSVYRGFTAAELAAMVATVTGVTPLVRRGVFWRLTATWTVPPR